MNYLKFDKKEYLTFCAAAECDNRLYISDPNNRGLIEYNLNSKETKIKNIFMAENDRNNYCSAFLYNDEIWFLPVRDNQKIAIYDISNNNIEYMAIPRSEHKCEYLPFWNSYIVGDKVYLTPAYYDCLLSIDLISKEIERIDIGIYSYSGDIHATYKSSCLERNKIYFCPFNNTEVKCYDVSDNTIENIPVQVSSGTYTDIYVKEGMLYLMPQKLTDGILKYNLLDESQQVIRVDDNYEDSTHYECSFIINNCIYGLPYNGNTMYIFDCLDNKIEIRKIDDDSGSLFSYYSAQEISGDRLLVASNNGKTPCLIWGKDNVEIIDVKLPDDFFIKELLMELEERR